MRKKWMKILPKLTDNFVDPQEIQCPNCGEQEVEYLYIGNGCNAFSRFLLVFLLTEGLAFSFLRGIFSSLSGTRTTFPSI